MQDDSTETAGAHGGLKEVEGLASHASFPQGPPSRWIDIRITTSATSASPISITHQNRCEFRSARGARITGTGGRGGGWEDARHGVRCASRSKREAETAPARAPVSGDTTPRHLSCSLRTPPWYSRGRSQLGEEEGVDAAHATEGDLTARVPTAWSTVCASSRLRVCRGFGADAGD